MKTKDKVEQGKGTAAFGLLIQYSKLKFEMVPYFGLISCMTVTKIFSLVKMSLISIKLQR